MSIVDLIRYGWEKGKIPFSRTRAGKARRAQISTTTRDMMLQMRRQGFSRGDASQEDIEKMISADAIKRAGQ